MAVNAGRALLISLDAGSGSVEITGQTNGTITVNREPIDKTTKSADGIRQLMADIGTFSVDISFEGVLTDATLITELFDAAPSALYPGSIVIGSVGTLTGDFFLGGGTIPGQDGPNTIGYTGNIMSAGTVTFTP